jgi:hypothetical protein
VERWRKLFEFISVLGYDLKRKIRFTAKMPVSGLVIPVFLLRDMSRGCLGTRDPHLDVYTGDPQSQTPFANESSLRESRGARGYAIPKTTSRKTRRRWRAWQPLHLPARTIGYRSESEAEARNDDAIARLRELGSTRERGADITEATGQQTLRITGNRNGRVRGSRVVQISPIEDV